MKITRLWPLLPLIAANRPSPPEAVGLGRPRRSTGKRFRTAGMALAAAALCAFPGTRAEILFSGERKLNNFASELLNAKPGESERFAFTRPSDGWIFVSLSCEGTGAVRVLLDKESSAESLVAEEVPGRPEREAIRWVGKGRHTLQLEGEGGPRVTGLVVRAIPELIHCGLGFDPAIKGYGTYDLAFLKRDVLPNVTTLIIPSNLKLDPSQIQDWHRQGKRFVAEVGVDSHAQDAADHFKYWTSFYERSPFLDGLIIDEFIVNLPVAEWATITPERLARMDQERRQYAACGEAIQRIRADRRYANKMLYAYIGGSGKKLNQEIIGTNFIRTVLNCGYRLAPERYLHEMSSPKGSQEALQTFVDGIADWEKKEPGVTKQMVITFGLFSMPPGGINKQPNVDYHVWMDQQMKLTATHPLFSQIAGLNWWTSSLADEETVRFVGKLYRHYAIDGKTDLLTKDPLFLTHLQNADFEKGTEGWALHPAEPGSIAPKSFPRYGRIEGRFMGLGRPADPEHIGDTFLWMKRNPKGPNTFSQIVRDLEPGRLYSMKMFSCEYQDLVHPAPKKLEQATPFIGSVDLKGVEVDQKRSFSEMYPSSPEPTIPVWITYHWNVFRAKSPSAELVVSDWGRDERPGLGFGQEQVFNFLEVQPYWE